MNKQHTTAVHMPGLYTTGFIIGVGTGLLSTVAVLLVIFGLLPPAIAAVAWGIAMGYAIWRHGKLRRYEKQFLTDVARDRIVMIMLQPYIDKAMEKQRAEGVVPENKELH